MPKFAANLSTLFPELDVPDRFGAAAAAGFGAVEFLRPYDWPKEAVRGWLDAAGLEFLLLNTLGRNAETGDPGANIIPGREAEFRANFDLALDYVTALGGTMIHMTAGPVPDNIPAAACEQAFIGNIKEVAPVAEAAGVTLMLEPLCDLAVANYLHSTSAQTLRLMEAVGAPQREAAI